MGEMTEKTVTGRCNKIKNVVIFHYFRGSSARCHILVLVNFLSVLNIGMQLFVPYTKVHRYVMFFKLQ